MRPSATASGGSTPPATVSTFATVGFETLDASLSTTNPVRAFAPFTPRYVMLAAVRPVTSADLRPESPPPNGLRRE